MPEYPKSACFPCKTIILVNFHCYVAGPRKEMRQQSMGPTIWRKLAKPAQVSILGWEDLFGALFGRLKTLNAVNRGTGR